MPSLPSGQKAAETICHTAMQPFPTGKFVNSSLYQIYKRLSFQSCINLKPHTAVMIRTIPHTCLTVPLRPASKTKAADIPAISNKVDEPVMDDVEAHEEPMQQEQSCQSLLTI